MTFIISLIVGAIFGWFIGSITFNLKNETFDLNSILDPNLGFLSAVLGAITGAVIGLFFGAVIGLFFGAVLTNRLTGGVLGGLIGGIFWGTSL